MAARGPDGAGEWWSADRAVGLAHRRLAIIDLSERAGQPMTWADGRFTITFNGEIYNHAELRRSLEIKGHRFRTTSDTEVLLALYAERGARMVEALRGMFAFAIWDADTRSLFLCRDPFGIKPLYCCDDGRSFRFASQVKALVAGGVSPAVDAAGLAGFCILGSVPEPLTIFSAIEALPAGTTLIVRASGAERPQPYFSVAEELRVAGRAGTSRADVADRVTSALRDSVRHHLVSDVPVGLFLSAGIDSGALAGLAAQQSKAGGGNALRAITLGFDEFAGLPDDEAPLARELADRYGLDHVVRRVGADEFVADLPRILSAMDQPTVDGINTWFVSKAAREQGMKVALSGLGGDELFGGYPSFRDVPLWSRWLAWPSRVPGLGGTVRRLMESAPVRSRLNPKLPGFLELGGSYEGAYLLRRGIFMPWELPALVGPTAAREGLERLDLLGRIRAAMEPDPGAPFFRISALETSLYMRNQLLRDTDWASMAHSLEVRVPLVDPVLLRQLAPVLLSPDRADGKELLSNAPSPALPDAIRRRPKTGFRTPIHRWLDRVDTGSQPVPTTQRGHWSRRWVATVLKRYNVDLDQRAAA